MRPRYIILALYLANDLDDTCNLINQLEFWKNWAKEKGFNIEACCNFRQSDTPVQQTGIYIRFTRMWDRIQSILTNTATGSLIAYYSKSLLIKKPNPDYTVIINEELNKTIIKHTRISQHKRATDLAQANIALAFEITKTTIFETKRIADNNMIQFSVVFIPFGARLT